MSKAYSRTNYDSVNKNNSLNRSNTTSNRDKNDQSLDSIEMTSEYMNSIKDENYKIYIQKKYDYMLQVFNEMDTDGNGSVDCDEMLSYLNKHMKDGDTFDEVLSKKIFDLIDIDHDNKCSLNEFVKTYIQIEEELKINVMKISKKYEAKNNQYNIAFANAQKYKNEIMIEDNLSDNAKLNISILKMMSTQKEYENFYIRIIYNQEQKQTSTIQLHSEQKNENFEFKVKSLEDQLILQVYNENSEEHKLIGKISIPVSNLGNMDENECTIDVPDQNNEDIVIAQILMKIQMIPSFYSFYMEQCEFIEQEKEMYSENIRKIRIYLENLNKPLSFNQELSNDLLYRKYHYTSYLEFNQNLPTVIEQREEKKDIRQLSNDEYQNKVTFGETDKNFFPRNEKRTEILEKDISIIEVESDLLLDILYIALIIIEIISILFLRSNFTGLLISIVIFSKKNYSFHFDYQIISKLLLGDIIYDIIYGILFITGNLFSLTDYKSSFRELTKIVIFIEIIVKSVIYYKLHRKFSQESQNKELKLNLN